MNNDILILSGGGSFLNEAMMDMLATAGRVMVANCSSRFNIKFELRFTGVVMSEHDVQSIGSHVGYLCYAIIADYASEAVHELSFLYTGEGKSHEGFPSHCITELRVIESFTADELVPDESQHLVH